MLMVFDATTASLIVALIGPSAVQLHAETVWKTIIDSTTRNEFV